MGVSGIKISLRCENFAFTFLKMFLIERADINMFQERIFTVKPVCFTHARHEITLPAHYLTYLAYLKLQGAPVFD